MTPACAAKRGFKVWKTNIGAQKIDGFSLDTFKIVLAKFLVENKFDRAWFFKKTFLIANTILEMIFKMLFLTFSNIDI